jgi:nicotinamidase-related amidase
VVALLVIDMQVGCFAPPALPLDLEGVVGRINALSSGVRAANGLVVYLQHDGEVGSPFAPETEGWELVSELNRAAGDPVVHKRACDAFYETSLRDLLLGRGPLIVTGYATEFCVDTTIRAAASLDFEVTVASDAHTTVERPHLDAASIVQHHSKVWEGLILPRSAVKLLSTEEILCQLEI